MKQGIVDIYAKFKKHIFPNGLELYSLQESDANFEAVGFIVYAGYRQDPDGKEGLAHFIEHLVVDNCPLGPEKINKLLRQHGGNCNFGKTSNLDTGSGFYVLANERVLHRVFSIFSKMLISSDFEKQVKTRRVVANEIIQSRGNETGYELFKENCKAVYSRHPHFGKAIRPTGTQETLSAITTADVQGFYDQYYVPANMSIVACGALSEEKLIKIISQTDFVAAKSGVRNPLPSKIFLPAMPKKNLFFGQGTKDGSDKFWNCCLSAVLPGKINPWAVKIFVRGLEIILEKRLRNSRLGIYNVGAGWNNCIDFYDLSVRIHAVPREKSSDVLRNLNACFLEIGRNRNLFKSVKSWSIAALKLNDDNGRELVKGVINDLLVLRKNATLKERIDNYQGVDFSDIQEICEWLIPKRRWVAFSKM
jgi:hypothetical protein